MAHVILSEQQKLLALMTERSTQPHSSVHPSSSLSPCVCVMSVLC